MRRAGKYCFYTCAFEIRGKNIVGVGEIGDDEVCICKLCTKRIGENGFRDEQGCPVCTVDVGDLLDIMLGKGKGFGIAQQRYVCIWKCRTKIVDNRQRQNKVAEGTGAYDPDFHGCRNIIGNQSTGNL